MIRGRFEGENGENRVVNGAGTIGLHLDEAAGVIITTSEEGTREGQEDGEQREQLIVYVAHDKLVCFRAVLKNMKVLRLRSGRRGDLEQQGTKRFDDVQIVSRSNEGVASNNAHVSVRYEYDASSTAKHPERSCTQGIHYPWRER